MDEWKGEAHGEELIDGGVESVGVPGFVPVSTPSGFENRKRRREHMGHRATILEALEASSAWQT